MSENIHKVMKEQTLQLTFLSKKLNAANLVNFGLE